jgi:aminocarboxymuconate-semialdehyde decarboxylase
MKIDIHGHFVDPHYLDELKRVMRLDIEQTSDGKTLLRHNGYTLAWTRPDMFDMDHRLRDMDRKGIDRRVLTVSTPSVYPWVG